MTIIDWVGGKGVWFAIHDGARFCIEARKDGFRVSAEGTQIGYERSLVNAKLFVRTYARDTAIMQELRNKGVWCYD
jgi:hypothetical protein